MQEDHDAVPPQVLHVDGIGDNAAPGADHGTALRQSCDHLPLLFPEALLAVLVEDVRDGPAGLLLDQGVRVKEGEAGLFCNDLPDLGLPGAAEPAEHDPLHTGNPACFSSSQNPGNDLFTHSAFVMVIPPMPRPSTAKLMAVRWSFAGSIVPPCSGAGRDGEGIVPDLHLPAQRPQAFCRPGDTVALLELQMTDTGDGGRGRCALRRPCRASGRCPGMWPCRW